MVEFEFSHWIVYSCVRVLEGGGMSSSSFTISDIVDANEVHGIFIVLRLVVGRLGDWLLTEMLSFWFPLLSRAKSLSEKLNFNILITIIYF